MVWDPKRITRKTWGEAAAFYRNLEDRNPDFQPLRELVEHAGRQPYAGALEVATSGTALLVGPLDTSDWATAGLRLDVDLSGAVRLTAEGRVSSPPSTVEGALVAAFERKVHDAGWA